MNEQLGVANRGIQIRFFPPTLTSERRGEIIVFKQGEDESLYNA